MRQKKEVMVVVVIVLCLVIALIAFATLRSCSRHEEIAKHKAPEIQMSSHQPDDTHDHIHTDQPVHGDHHKHELELSGELVNGVRIVKMKARRFEFDPSTVVVKAEEKVRLEVTSKDVAHGIEIKDFGINQVLKPGKTEIVTFVADKPGSYHFHCSVYCGKGHDQMHGELVVLSD